jgi:hypothetical protein
MLTTSVVKGGKKQWFVRQQAAMEAPNSPGGSLAPLHNIEGNTRYYVEQDNGDFVKQYPGKVYGVKLRGRQMKPSDCKTMHPTIRKHVVQPPPQKQSIVDYRTPQEHFA